MTETIKIRRGSSSTAYADNPVLSDGEPGLETDTGRFAIGDGTRDWESVPTMFTRAVRIESGNDTLDDHHKINVYTGTAAGTWTLPPVAQSVGAELNIYNRGSATLTLLPASADQMYDLGSGAVTTFQALAGTFHRLLCDGYFWLVCN